MHKSSSSRSAKRTVLAPFFVAGAACWLSSCTTISRKPLIDVKTDAVLTAMSEKLAAAKTIRVTALRSAPVGLHAGLKVAEAASGTISVQRPATLVAQMRTSEGARSIGLSAGVVTIVDHAAGTHATVKARGDIDQALRDISNTYGIMPPVAELLVNQPREFLLAGVKSGRYVGSEKIGGVVCDHLAFTQKNMTWDMWVASGDHLPRRLSMSYSNGKVGMPLVVSATIMKWEMGAALAADELSVSVPKKSHLIEVIPLED